MLALTLLECLEDWATQLLFDAHLSDGRDLGVEGLEFLFQSFLFGKGFFFRTACFLGAVAFQERFFKDSVDACADAGCSKRHQHGAPFFDGLRIKLIIS